MTAAAPSVQVCRQTACGVRFRVRVQPRSSHDRVAGLLGDAVKIQVTAAPVEGAANHAVVAVIAAWLGIPRRTVAILHGQTGRDKVIEIATAHPADLAARVEAACTALR